MTELSPQAAITIAAGAITGLVWLVRLEGRVNGHDRELKDTKDTHSEEITTLRADVQYIRQRIDSALDMGSRRHE